MSRKRAREGLMKFLYQSECIPADDGDLEIFIENFDYSESESEFIVRSYEKIIQNLECIDSIIESNLKDWSISRLNRIDKSVLRLAINEILFMDDIPESVSVNEAVEIAKNYSTESSPSFINGVLGKVIRDRKMKA